MRIDNKPRDLGGGVIEPAHTIEQVCAHCGYDLDAAELASDVCADCGKPLDLKQNISIRVTTLPDIFGESM